VVISAIDGCIGGLCNPLSLCICCWPLEMLGGALGGAVAFWCDLLVALCI
jgi:hypothetical protein